MSSFREQRKELAAACPPSDMPLKEKLCQHYRFGLGLAALGRPGYMNLGHADDMPAEPSLDEMQKHAFTVFDAAWQQGVRYFDVARSYGQGEMFLANWLDLRQIPPEQVFVASKWGYTYTAGWRVNADQHEVKDHSLSAFLRQWKESRTFLGKYLKLYQIHSATLESGVLDDELVLDALAGLKPQGVLVGLSVSGPHQGEVIRKALEIKREGKLLFNAVQATFNAMEPSSGKALKEAHKAGLGVIIKEGLANGKLTSRGEVPNWLDELAKEKQTRVDALALGFVLAQPFADVVLSGAAKPEHLHSNLGASSLPKEIFEDDRWEALAVKPADYWKQRSKMEWN